MTSEEHGPLCKGLKKLTTAANYPVGLEVGLSPIKPSDQTPAPTEVIVSACKRP